MSDEHPSAADSSTPGSDVGAQGWIPPREQQPPFPWTPPGPPPSQPTYDTVSTGRPYVPPAGPRRTAPSAGEGRVPGWLWPVVSVLALVIGVLGGVLGGAAYQSWHTGSGEGQVAGGLSGAGTVSRAPLPISNHSVASVAQQLLPSTVQVLAQYQGRKDGATGSGFVLDHSGHYLTNNHVVADAVSHHGPIEIVDQNGDEFPATVVGRSPTYDLAVLYVKDHPALPPASLGSDRALRVGDQVVAFGSPLGLSSTVTAGIVSALNRPVTTGETESSSSYINAVQTDAAINPGNSGGPLVDLSGRVVGVNSAIATTGGSSTSGESGSIGVGFAIPIDQVKVTADQILRTGQARYPVIGASVDTLAATGSGARILDVTPDGPAASGGLQKGDVVTAVEGEKVADGIALIVAIRAHRPGEDVRFTVDRGGTVVRVRITLGSKVG